MKLLVEEGADMDSKDAEYGRTPLSWAVVHKHEAVVKLKRFPHTNPEVRHCVEEEWARLQLVDFVKYIGNMRERCQAVIDAEGGHTKW
jgi:hypothetical protein